MQELFGQMLKMWESLSLKQRMSLLISAAVTIAAVGSIIWWAKQPTYSTLFTGLDPKDAQQIVTALQGKQVPFELKNGGTEVDVPIEQVDSLRMELVAQGMPTSGRFGFTEMFSADNFAQSNKMQQLRYQKALEDELASTIETLDEVKSARVHLVIPGDRVFLDDQSTSKASVTLSLARGTRIANEQVQAIVRIVAGAVRDLRIENVSVLDTNGHVLWEGGGEGGAFLSARQLEQKSATEADINNKISKVLEPVIGAGKYVARASVDLDFQKVVRHELSYDPNSGVLISESKQKEKSNNSSDAAGVPGTASNLPGATGNAGGGANENRESNNQQSNFEYSKVERSVEEPVGSLKRVSVAVLVDQIWPAGSAEGDASAQSQPRSPEELKKIEELVKAAISFDPNRGDVVKVDQAPFLREAVEKVDVGTDYKKWIPLVKYPALVVLLLIVFVLFFRPLLKTIGSAASVPARAVETASASARLDAPLQLGPASKVEVMRQRLTSLASEEPVGMAQTVRVWLHEKE